MPDNTETDPTLAEQAAAVRGQIARTLADAEAKRTEASELVARAGRLRTEAQTMINATRGQELAAAEIEARARSLAAVPGLEAQAAAADAKGEAFTAERAELLERVAGLDRRAEIHRAEQEQLRGQLAAALEAGDIDAVTAANSRIAALGAVLETLGRQRKEAQGRATAAGTEATAAHGNADRIRADIRRRLNHAYPSRPEAVYDRGEAEFVAAADASAERRASEQRGAEAEQRRPAVTRIPAR
jgi:hypothetical protein